MKNLSNKISEINEFVEAHAIRSVSFDIDGTVYPIIKVQRRWWKRLFISPFEAMRFFKIKMTWEKRRKGDNNIPVASIDVHHFETFLKSVLDKALVPEEIRNWISELNKRGVKVYFLSDHSAEMKLSALGLLKLGQSINCLTETGQLKPHDKITELLKSKYQISPSYHLHLGDRWTDDAQAKLLGSHFLSFKL